MGVLSIRTPMSRFSKVRKMRQLTLSIEPNNNNPGTEMNARSSDEVKIGLIQMEMTDNKVHNLDKAIRMIGKAASKGAQIVCLPELFSTLYFPQDENSNEKPVPIPNFITRSLSKAARENGIILIGGSIYEKSGNKSYNTSPVFDQNGKILGKYRKIHLPQDPGFYEQDYFSKGNNFSVYETKFGKIGVLICFDQWYPEPPRILKLKGADIIFYPTAIGWVDGIEPAEGDWHKAWESVQIGHAISNSVIVAAVNRVGTERNMKFWGGSFVCDQFGKILAKADDQEQVIVAKCDLGLAKEIEDGWGFFRNRVPNSYKLLVK
jgi:predicted amidohydrolase